MLRRSPRVCCLVISAFLPITLTVAHIKKLRSLVRLDQTWANHMHTEQAMEFYLAIMRGLRAEKDLSMRSLPCVWGHQLAGILTQGEMSLEDGGAPHRYLSRGVGGQQARASARINSILVVTCALEASGPQVPGTSYVVVTCGAPGSNPEVPTTMSLPLVGWRLQARKPQPHCRCYWRWRPKTP